MDDPFRPPTPPPAIAPPPMRQNFFLWSIPISGAIHLFIALFCLVLMFRNFRGCAIDPGTGASGEHGRSGSGGTEVEVSLENPPAERMGGGHPAAEAAPPAPAPAPAPPQQPQPPATQPSTSHTQHPPTLRAHAPTPENEPAEAPPPAPAIPRGDPSANAHANTDPAHPASSPSEYAPGAPGGGTGDLLRNSGMRPGSIGSQRALLPRAVHCDDPMAGIWRAQKYDPLYGDWMLATLFVHRGENNVLHGTMAVHQWDGGPFAVSPPACGPDGFDFIVDEPAHGFARDRFLDFGADGVRLRTMRCNGSMRLFDYRPDHFTGIVDSGREEFQSVNNDGGRAVNDPMVFRRIGCLDEGAPANDVSGSANPADGGSSRAPAM